MAKRQRAAGRPPDEMRAARMAARNSGRARRRRVRRRRRRRILFMIVCAVLVAAAAISATTVFFRVSEVTIAGDTRYSQQELIASSGVQDGDNLILLDSAGITDSLMRACPYLKEVRLHRKLPSTLQIEVSDRVPILSVENGGSYLLLDDEGKVVDSAGMVQEGTVEVTGADTQELAAGMTADESYEKLTTVLDMMALLTKYEMNGDIVSIDISRAYDVRVQYQDRYTVLFGNMDELEHKIQFLLAILQEPSLPESGVIDLSDDTEARYRPTTESTESVELDEDTGADGEESSDDGTDDGTDDSTDDGTDDSTDDSADDSSDDGADDSSDDSTDDSAEDETETGAESEEDG